MVDEKKLAEKVKKEGLIGVEFTEEEAEWLGLDLLKNSNMFEQGYDSSEEEDEEFLKEYTRENEINK